MSNKIKEIIENTLKACSDDQEIYSNIMKDFFTKGIEKPSIILKSLGTNLPNLKEKDIKNNIEKNIEEIKFFISKELGSLELYKALSCIYGAFFGDALGAFCEFTKYSDNNYKSIFNTTPVFGGEKGQVTDDSEMSMSFAYAIMDNPIKEDIDVNYLYFYYGAWSQSNPVDIGNTTKEALSKFDFQKSNPKNKNFESVEKFINEKNKNSLSNGFLMRKSTFIVWIYYRFYREVNEAFKESNNNNNKLLISLYEKIKKLSNIDNKCTNPNPEADAVSAFYCIMVLGALIGLKSNNIIDKIVSLCNDNYFQKKDKDNEDKKICQFITFFVDKFKSKDFDYIFFFGDTQSNDCINENSIGWYVHSLKLTLYYLINFEKYKKNTFRTIMDEICNFGGDTDTNACIVGCVIGPLIGMKNFGDKFDNVINLIPKNRAIYSILLMVPYVFYLKYSNRNDKFIKDEHYFLRTILTLIYDTFDLDYTKK